MPDRVVEVTEPAWALTSSPHGNDLLMERCKTLRAMIAFADRRRPETAHRPAPTHFRKGIDRRQPRRPRSRRPQQ